MHVEAEISRVCEQLAELHLGPLNADSGLLGSVASITYISKSRMVTDAVGSFLLLDPEGLAIGVAQVSDVSSPALVRRGMNAAIEARRILGPGGCDSIIEPLCGGEVDGRSYVVWPWRRPLVQQGWAWWICRSKVQRSVRDWLRQIVGIAAAGERSSEVEERYHQMLKRVKLSDSFSPKQQHAAEIAIDRLHSGQWQPVSIMDHNDLWRGNVHWNLDARGRSCGISKIVIIDWYGANEHGFGFYDLVRWAASVGMSSRALADEIRVHAEILGIEPCDARGHLLATLGRLAIHREQFPLDRLQKLIRATWDRFENADV